MRKLFGTIVLALLSVFGQNVQAQEASSLLWKISGNGLSQPSYVYGTIHMICPDDMVITDETKSALGECEQLVLELDMDDPTLMSEMQKFALNPGMKNISSEFTEEELDTLNTFFNTHFGVGMDQLGYMRPFTLLSMALTKGFECENLASYEMEFVEYAHENEWEVLGLETVAEQMAVIDKSTQEEQIKWLLDYLNDQEEMTDALNEMVRIYLSQDLDALSEFMTESPEMNNGMEEHLLDERNEKWIDPMIEFATEKSTFFAVGAAHLGTEQGVLALLKEKGYTVEAVQ